MTYGGTMSFNGSIIKTKIKDARKTIQSLSKELGVSRQTVNGWIGGSVPRGSHLVGLCTALNLKPSDFFSASTDNVLSVPLHRTIRKTAITQPMRSASLELAEQYLNLFRQVSTVDVLSVVRVQDRNLQSAAVIANQLRKISGVENGKPMDYECAFRLLSESGIYTIFRAFPEDLKKKTYAFYSKIADKRVVFVNIDTSVLDLIFYLLHETVHAVRDEVPDQIDNQAEEDFCDNVTNFAQFPTKYIDDIAMLIEGLDADIVVNRLKEVSRRHKHSLYGIYLRLVDSGALPENLTNIGGAATNLSKEFPTLREILFGSGDVRTYLDRMYHLSPKFMNIISENISDCSSRKLAEWLGLDTSMDAQVVIDDILRRKAQR